MSWFSPLTDFFGVFLNPAIWLPAWATLALSKIFFPTLNTWLGDGTGFDWLLS